MRREIVIGKRARPLAHQAALTANVGDRVDKLQNVIS